MTTKTTTRYCVAAITLLGTLPQIAFGQAGIVSEREEIVSYSAEDLNPAQPGYEWAGATLLQNIRVIDGLGNRPQTGQDLLVADGKIVNRESLTRQWKN